MSRRHHIRRHYEARVSPHRDTYDILDWGSRDDQIARFEILLRIITDEGLQSEPSIIDVGCGMTDLAAFLEECGLRPHYLGVDITYGILAEAKRRFPQRHLLQADVFHQSPVRPGSVDVAYCSGVFNLQLGNNEAFAVDALPRLADLAGRMAVVNFLHTRSARKYDHCHYYDPQLLMTAMEERGYEVRLIDDYLENDFTLVLKQT